MCYGECREQGSISRRDDESVKISKANEKGREVLAALRESPPLRSEDFAVHHINRTI
jgi:hypothetical protein